VVRFEIAKKPANIGLARFARLLRLKRPLRGEKYRNVIASLLGTWLVADLAGQSIIREIWHPCLKNQPQNDPEKSQA